MLLRRILFFAAPMLLGLLVHRYLPRAAGMLQRPAGVLAMVAFGILIVLALIGAVPILGRFGFASAAIVVAFVAVAIAVGHLMGAPLATRA